MSVFGELRELMIKNGNPTRGTRLKISDPDTGEFGKVQLVGVSPELTPESIKQTAREKGMTGRIGVKTGLVVTDDDFEFPPGSDKTDVILDKLMSYEPPTE